MYGIIKHTICLATLMFAVSSCGNAAKEAATELYDASEEAIAHQDYLRAIELLDTLNTRHADQTEIRRRGLGLRARAMEGIALDSIQTVDSELARATLAFNELEQRFRHIDPPAPGIDGYYIPKGVDRQSMTATGIQARVSDEGYFYIVANVQNRKIGLRAIQLKDRTETCTSADVAPARVITVRNSETASFSPEETSAFGSWLAEHPQASEVILLGSRGNAKINLRPALRTEISDCAAFSAAILAKRSATIRREKFERMLATARDQIANLAETPQQQ